MSSADKGTPPKSLSDRFEAYLMRHHLEDVRAIVRHADSRHPHSIAVDSVRFTHELPQLANAVLARPTTSIGVLDEAARAAQEIVKNRMMEDLKRKLIAERRRERGGDGSKDDDEEERMREKMTEFMRRHRVKQTVRVRVDFERFRSSFPSLNISGYAKNEHAGRLWTMKAKVTRVGLMKTVESDTLYECAKCGHRFLLPRNLEDGRPEPTMPEVCPSAEEKANHIAVNSAATGRTKTKTCTNRTFRQVECSMPIARDYQEICVHICGDGEDDDEEETDSDEENDGFKADAQKLVHSVNDVDGRRERIARKYFPEDDSENDDVDSDDELRAIGLRSKANLGGAQKSLLVVLQDDLVDAVKCGDELLMSVVIRRRWLKASRDRRCEIELVAHCNSLTILSVDDKEGNAGDRKTNEVEDDQEYKEMEAFFEKFWQSPSAKKYPLRARDIILKSCCPRVFGMAGAKLAMMLALVGGVAREDIKTKTKVRGEVHLLYVGDPGIGKSQLLKTACRLAKRSVFTTGCGSTAAGLTCAAVKDLTSGEWGLEAGALVLADKGTCCVDEFDGIREHERATIHEAMEQQTLSVAKAGIIATLNSRTSVIAATNPKRGTFDDRESLAVNTGLAPPLLSRFDVVLVLRDARDPEWDERVASHILGETSENSGNINKRLKFSASAQKKPFSFDGWRASQNANADNININNRELYVPANDTNRYRSYNQNEFADDRDVSDSDADDENETGEDVQFFYESTALWSFSRVKKYIKYVKSRFEPTLDEDAERMLSEHYQNRRRQVAENRLELGRATVRALESSIRLAQAHAKLCFRNVATKIDATVAIELIGCSEDEMMGNTMNHIGQKGVGILMRDFARYPDRKLSKAFKTFDFDECNGADEFPRIDRNYTRIQ